MTIRYLAIITLSLCCLNTSVLAMSQAELEAKIKDTSATIHIKEKNRNDLQEELTAVKENLRINSAENTDLSIQVKQLQLQERKVRLLSDKPEEIQSEELSKLQYKIRVAEIAQKKNRQDVKQLSRRKREITQRLERLDMILATKHEQLDHLKSQRKYVKKDRQRQKQMAQIQRQAAQEKRLQEQLQKQQQATAEARLQAVENDYNEKLRQERLRREREIQNIRNQNLPPHEAAMSMAKLVAQEPTDSKPAFGDTPHFLVARPVKSKPKHLTDFKHLGNNQYFARASLRKGRQSFYINDTEFIRVISPHFDRKECLILVDARTDNTSLQIYPIN